MATLSALIVAKNEEDFVKLCLDHIVPFVDQVVFVDNGSTDYTKKIAQSYEKVEVYDYPETQNMCDVRNFSLSKATGDFFIQIDCDEIYPESEMRKIRAFVESPGDAISARVKYKNLAWKEGFAQAGLNHFPDRIYRRDAVEGYRGVLPVDMTYVKKEYLDFPNKTKGDIGPLEYDNENDESKEHPRQPILDVTYYHLARTRGHHFEYNKWLKYNKNMHPEWTLEQVREATIYNAWVNGVYAMEPIAVPEGIPTKTIPEPKVSVIVTCYNKGQWISECLDSILNQTYKPYEVIVVDDCSTDDSRDIINRYDVTKIYHSYNKGVCPARNDGLMEATGDYFVLIDGDDKLKPDFIEKCLSEMKDGATIVSTDFEGLGEWAGRIHRYPHPFDKEALKGGQTFPSVMALYDMRHRSPYGNFQERFMAEDAAWWLELVFRKDAKVVHIPEPLCCYRRTIGSRVDQTDLRHDEAMAQLNQEYGVHYA